MKIGDKVKIKKPGYIYSQYVSMFKKLGFKNPNKSKELEFNKFKDIIFTIFIKCKHVVYPHPMLFGIEDNNGNQFLIESKGLIEAEPKSAGLSPKKIKYIKALHLPTPIEDEILK